METPPDPRDEPDDAEGAPVHGAGPLEGPGARPDAGPPEDAAAPADDGWEDWDDDDWAAYDRRRRRVLLLAGVGAALVVVLLVGGLAFALTRDDGEDVAATGTDGVPTDTFNRHTSFSEVGVAANGDAWDAIAGVWGIDAAQVFLAEASLDGQRNVLVLDTGSPDGEVAVTFARVRKGAGLVFRWASADDYWLLAPVPEYGTWSVQHWEGGELTTNENVGLAHADDGTQAFVRLDGGQLEVQIDELEPVSFDIGTSDARGAGFSALGEGVGQARWDDFYALPR